MVRLRKQELYMLTRSIITPRKNMFGIHNPRFSPLAVVTIINCCYYYHSHDYNYYYYHKRAAKEDLDVQGKFLPTSMEIVFHLWEAKHLFL